MYRIGPELGVAPGWGDHDSIGDRIARQLLRSDAGRGHGSVSSSRWRKQRRQCR